MNIRRFLCLAGTFTCLTLLSTAAWALDVSEWSYAAIAYAPSTGNYRYSYNYGSRYAAEQAALRGMTEKDAKIVCWVNRGFAALALGDDVGAYGTGWEWGDEATNTAAMETALANCRENTKGARIVLCLVSDGQYIYHPKPVVRQTPIIESSPPTPSLAPALPQFPSLNPPFAPVNPRFDPYKPVGPFNSRFHSFDSSLDPNVPQFAPFNPIVPQPNPLLPQLNPAPGVFP